MARRTTENLKLPISAWRLISAVAMILLAPAPIVLAQASTNLASFAGSWRGQGKLSLASGKTESIRCRVNLKIHAHLGEARQSMRCTSTANEVMIYTTIKFDGPKVNGIWREKTRGVQGEIAGRVRKHQSRLTMSGPDVAASMTSTLANNVQSVRVSGKLGKIRKLQIRLRRTSRR